MKTVIILKHDDKITLKGSDSGLDHFGYVFDVDLYGLIEKGKAGEDDPDLGKIFILKESTVIDGCKKDRSQNIELKLNDVVYMNGKKFKVRLIGWNYSDMAILKETKN